MKWDFEDPIWSSTRPRVSDCALDSSSPVMGDGDQGAAELLLNTIQSVDSVIE
jgi:hypothetical protein